MSLLRTRLKAVEPQPAQVAPPPAVQIIPTLPIEHASVRPSRKRCRSPPPASSIPPPDVPSPHRRLSLPQPNTSAEAIVPEFVIPEATATVAPVRRRRMVEARGWLLLRTVSILGGTRRVSPDLRWRRVLQPRYTRSPREISIARIESDEQEIETLHVRAMWAEAQRIDWSSVSLDGFMTERALGDLRSILAFR
ncbi:hypothetical protein Tco_0061155, partial [Tanacetum coccineum]